MGAEVTDERQIRDLADRLTTAEMAGDAAFLLAAFTPDAVIIPPFMAAIEGPEARALFVETILGRNAEELLDRSLTYEIVELRILGDWAFERGQYLHAFVPKDPSEEGEERGQYVRLYERCRDGAWRVARIIWNLMPGPESEGDRETPSNDEPRRPESGDAGPFP